MRGKIIKSLLVVEDQCRIKCGYFSQTIVTVRIVVMLLKLISHNSMKYRVKSDTNMIDSFDSNSEKFFYPILHLMESRYNRYITILEPKNGNKSYL